MNHDVPRVQLWDDNWVCLFDSAKGSVGFKYLVESHDSLHLRRMWPDGSTQCGEIRRDGRLEPW